MALGDYYAGKEGYANLQHIVLSNQQSERDVLAQLIAVANTLY